MTPSSRPEDDEVWIADGRSGFTLARLRAWASEWDDEGDGACWPASRFVQWIERNLTDYETRGDDTRHAGQRRWRG